MTAERGPRDKKPLFFALRPLDYFSAGFVGFELVLDGVARSLGQLQMDNTLASSQLDSLMIDSQP